MLRRLAPLSLAVVLLTGAVAAQAPRAYEVVATQAALDDGGVLSGAEPTCVLARRFAEPLQVLFYDRASGALARHVPSAAPGERTTVIATASEIAGVAGAPIVACRDALLPRPGSAYLVLERSDGRSVVASVDVGTEALAALTDPDSPADAGDGVTSMALDDSGDRLLLARRAADGAPEDGVYTLPLASPPQDPVPLVLDPQLDLVGIAHDPTTEPAEYVVASSAAGEGSMRNALLVLSGADTGAPQLTLAATPCEGPDALFESCDGGGLRALDIDVAQLTDFGISRIAVANEVAGAFEVGSYLAAFGLGPGGKRFGRETLFREDELVAAAGVEGLTLPETGGYLFLGGAGNIPRKLFVAAVDGPTATPGVYTVDVPVATVAETPAPTDPLAPAVTPNPTSGAARLALRLGRNARVRVEVFDALGRRVATLADGALPPGTHRIDLGSEHLAPGLYVARVTRSDAVSAVTFSIAR